MNDFGSYPIRKIEKLGYRGLSNDKAGRGGDLPGFFESLRSGSTCRSIEEMKPRPLVIRSSACLQLHTPGYASRGALDVALEANKYLRSMQFNR